MTRSGCVTRKSAGTALFFAIAFGVEDGRVRGNSLVMRAGGLSLRRPWNTAWRTWPPFVHSAKATSAISWGFTQCGFTRFTVPTRVGPSV
jgi:hypothetical protein